MNEQTLIAIYEYLRKPLRVALYFVFLIAFAGIAYATYVIITKQ